MKNLLGLMFVLLLFAAMVHSTPAMHEKQTVRSEVYSGTFDLPMSFDLVVFQAFFPLPQAGKVYAKPVDDPLPAQVVLGKLDKPPDELNVTSTDCNSNNLICASYLDYKPEKQKKIPDFDFSFNRLL